MMTMMKSLSQNHGRRASGQSGEHAVRGTRESNVEFLRAFADALRDILRDEHGRRVHG